jgi:hypothetical protein
MRTDSPPGGVAATFREGYGHPRVLTDREEGYQHEVASASLPVPPRLAPIFEVPCGGVGVAAYGHLGERPLRRGYAGAKMCRVRQEGLSLQTTSRTHRIESLAKPLGVTKGEGCALRNQESLFPSDHSRPTRDSIYLAQKIDAKWKSHRLTPAALQKLVDHYGDQAVEDKLRELYGFPPEEAVRSPFAYLSTMLRMSL